MTRTPKIINRLIIQVAALFAYNPFLHNFLTGELYRGGSKYLCTPGLNCYSCPAAAASCPVGSLQAVLSGRNTITSTYVVGFLLLYGALFGRFICGYLCPFGLYQEALYRIPGRKLIPSRKVQMLGLLRYPIFFLLVVGAPLLVVDTFGNGTAGFCAWICPAGTLEAGIPLMLTQQSLRSLAGILFQWKLFVLILLSALSVVLYRPFCRFLCPLGLIYGWFNRISLHQIKIDSSRCTTCGACVSSCKLQISIHTNPGSSECIRCGDCARACPHGAISIGFDIPTSQARTVTRN